MIRPIRAIRKDCAQPHPIHVADGVIGGVDVWAVPGRLFAEGVHGREAHDGGVVVAELVLVDVESVHLFVGLAVVLVGLYGLACAVAYRDSRGIVERLLDK